MKRVEATQEWCPATQEADQWDRHHLVPRAAGNGAQVMKCAYCGKTQAEIEGRK